MEPPPAGMERPMASKAMGTRTFTICSVPHSTSVMRPMAHKSGTFWKAKPSTMAHTTALH